MTSKILLPPLAIERAWPTDIHVDGHGPSENHLSERIDPTGGRSYLFECVCGRSWPYKAETNAHGALDQHLRERRNEQLQTLRTPARRRAALTFEALALLVFAVIALVAFTLVAAQTAVYGVNGPTAVCAVFTLVAALYFLAAASERATRLWRRLAR